jgi:hypothetical protein
MRLGIDQYSNDLIETTSLGSASTPTPGVILQFHSAMTPQPVEITLHSISKPEQDFFGMAKIYLVSDWPDMNQAGKGLSLIFKVEGDRLVYRSYRDSKQVAQGKAKKGDVLNVGWGVWTVEVTDFLAKAKLIVSAEEAPNAPQQQHIPGLHARLISPNGTEGDPMWILSGTSQTLTLGETSVRVGYGLKTFPLPFSVSLVDFKVPRDEGTDEPSNFISHVAFTNHSTGSQHFAKIEMNEPASYPPQFWKTCLGLNYKFSQAGWDPRQISETTLQVLYDPGWPLKWMGSLLISGGIFCMFYLRNKKSAAPKPSEGLS